MSCSKAANDANDVQMWLAANVQSDLKVHFGEF